MFFSGSERLKKQKINTASNRFIFNSIQISDAAKIKIIIALICLLSFFYISFFHQNIFAWGFNNPEVPATLQSQTLDIVNKDFYRVLLINLSKPVDNSIRRIQDVSVIAVDKQKKETKVIQLNINEIISYNDKSITLSELYSEDYDNVARNLSKIYGFGFEFVIVVNSDHYDTLSKKFDIEIDSKETDLKIIQEIQSDSYFFFKQSFLSSWYKNTLTNFQNDTFSKFLSDLRSTKQAIPKFVNKSDLKNGILADSALIREQLRIEVSNATNTKGLATEYGTIFENMGMTISKISNFELLTNESVIFASPENTDSVTLATIKSYLKNARVVYERPSKYSTADILIVVSD